MWIYAVDADKNIHIIRAVLILQGLCESLMILGAYVSVTLMPIGDASAIIFSSPLPTMIISKFVFGTRLKLYKVCCGILVILGIILVVQPPAMFGQQHHIRQEMETGSPASNESAKMLISQTTFIAGKVKNILNGGSIISTERRVQTFEKANR